MVTIIFTYLLVSSSPSWGNIKTHLKMDNNHLCIQSYSRSKCSLDAFTIKQSNAINKKIENIKSKIPDDIINNTLNHFWANHHTFSANQLLSIFENIDTPSCDLEASTLEKRKTLLQQKINYLTNQTLVFEKRLVHACMNSKTAKAVYPALSVNKTTQTK